MISFADAAWYAKFDGVDGESTDDSHKDWINLLSVDWGMHQSEAGATRRSSRIIMDDFVITKMADKTTPILTEPICKGEGFKKVEIELCKNNAGEQHCYLRYELKNVFITSYQIGGSAEGDSVPTEQLSLNFEEIKTTYIPLDEAGRPEEPVSAMCAA